MKYVYLCSRVAEDARPLNNRVAKSLRDSGFEVYVPHEQAPNNPDNGRYDKELIWKYDFAAMNKADLCVVVGRTGKDCAFEIGWFYAQGIPTYFVPDTDNTWTTSPMLIPALTVNPHLTDPETSGKEIQKLHNTRPISLIKFWMGK